MNKKEYVLQIIAIFVVMLIFGNVADPAMLGGILTYSIVAGILGFVTIKIVSYILKKIG